MTDALLINLAVWPVFIIAVLVFYSICDGTPANIVPWVCLVSMLSWLGWFGLDAFRDCYR